MSKKTVLVTCVGAPPGFNTARILSYEDDYDVIGVDADKYASGLYLDKVKPYVVPMVKEDNYIDSLVEVCKKENVNAIIPCFEKETLVISEHREVFEKIGVKLLLSPHETVEACCDKLKTMGQAEKAGISHPKTYLIDSKADLDKIDLEFPVVMKPAIGSGARGITYPKNKEELIDDYAILGKGGTKVLVQELVKGGPGRVYMCGLLYDKNHKLKVSYISKSLKTPFPNGGPAIVGVPLKNDEILNMAIKLLDSFGNYTGPAGVEFKIDEKDGKPKLMEINPRLWGYSCLAFGAGANIHKATAQLALDEDIGEIHDYDTNKLFVRSFDEKIMNKEEALAKINYVGGTNEDAD